MRLLAVLRLALLAVICGALLAPLSARAEMVAPLRPAPPSGEVILTISGLDPATYPEGVVSFDIEGLAALGPTSFSTGSIWTEGTSDFTGIALKPLLAALGVTEGSVLLTALNDYTVEMPLAEAEDQAPILAYLMDGKPMSVRDKGPIWVVFPYDSDPDAYQTETVFGRSVWQLNRIEVAR